MSIEDLVRYSVEDHATAQPPPRPDPAALARRGRRRVAYTVAGAGLGVAALLVATVAGVSVIRNQVSGPEPTNRSSHGTENGPYESTGPTHVYIHGDGRISFNGSTVPAVDGKYLHLAVNGIEYVDQQGRAHLIGLDGVDTQLAPDAPTKVGSTYGGWVAADSSSPLVVWTEETIVKDGADSTGSVDVVLYNSDTNREVARRTSDCRYDKRFKDVLCPGAYVISNKLVFADNGRKGLYGWNPGGIAGDGPEWFPLNAGFAMQAHDKSVLLFDYDGGDFSGLDPSWTVVPATENQLLSYEGRWLLEDDTITSAFTPKEKVTFDPPGTIRESQFDPSGDVLFSVKLGSDEDDDRFQVFACSALTVDCTPISEVEKKPFRLVNTDT